MQINNTHYNNQNVIPCNSALSFKSKIRFRDTLHREDLKDCLFLKYDNGKLKFDLDDTRKLVKNLDIFCNDGKDKHTVELTRHLDTFVFEDDNFRHYHYSTYDDRCNILRKFLKDSMGEPDISKLAPYEREALKGKINCLDDVLQVNKLLQEANSKHYLELIKKCFTLQ